MIKDYYKILNIDRKASLNEIKKSFRSLALKWHPDKNKAENANDIFIEINEAYEILSDEMKRSSYNTIYDDYFLGRKIVNPVERERTYEQYSHWQEEAIKEAFVRAKMSFTEFTTFINKVVSGVFWGCTTIFMIVLWISWGPYGVYYGAISLYEMIVEMTSTGFKFNFVLLVMLFAFSCFLTVKGLLVINKAMKTGEFKLNRE